MDDNNTSRQDLGDVLYCIENGIEYWTIKATGESALSEIGLSRLSGVPQKTINRWLNHLSQGKPVKGLEALTGKELYLSQVIKKRGGTINPLKAEVGWKIIRFAEKKGFDQATDTLDAIGEIGINSWLQGKTGWLPNEYQASRSSRDKLNRVVDKPCPWERLYTKELCKKVQKWFGFDSSKFYWWYCYSWMTQEERDKLDEVNPLSERGRRKRKIHQHFDPATKERMTVFAEHLGGCIEFCDSRIEFEKKWSRKYGTPEQLDLFDLWEFVN